MVPGGQVIYTLQRPKGFAEVAEVPVTRGDAVRAVWHPAKGAGFELCGGPLSVTPAAGNEVSRVAFTVAFGAELGLPHILAAELSVALVAFGKLVQGKPVGAGCTLIGAPGARPPTVNKGVQVGLAERLAADVTERRVRRAESIPARCACPKILVGKIFLTLTAGADTGSACHAPVMHRDSVRIAHRLATENTRVGVRATM